MAKAVYPPLRPTPYGRLFREGQPWVWMTRSGTAVLILMVVAIVAIVVTRGLHTFWPQRVVRFQMKDGSVVVGEEVRRETRKVGRDSRPQEQIQVRFGNREQVGVGHDYGWIVAEDVVSTTEPEDLLAFERLEYGPAYGRVKAVLEDGKPVASGADALPRLRRAMDAAADRRSALLKMQKGEMGELNHEIETIRLARRKAEMELEPESPEFAARIKSFDERLANAQKSYEEIAARVAKVQTEDARHSVLLEDGAGKPFKAAKPVSGILHVDEVNRLGLFQRFFLFVGRFWRFITEDPREANTDGGIWPALFGTVLMTLLMTLFVVPFGVMAALYLREYAKQGPLVSAVRIAVNNLAGVPSIVFGVFGLGFFCQLVGGWIDTTYFPERLPSPTFGGGGILWASATLALLTVPVVIVSTEEALAAVPKSLREAAIGCGASKWQTIRRIVLPHASPGILTGMILAMARGAGEVAPLMLTGVVKLADELPLDGHAPFFHPDRKIMHMAFSIYDTGFQSPNVDASTPLVYSTTLVLLVLVLFLNLGATLLRNKLRKRFRTGVFG